MCTALAATCKLIGPDLINAVLPAVTGLASHPKDLVRKKAVMALHRFQQLDPKHEGQLAGADLDSYYRQALCDKVPGLCHCVSALCVSMFESASTQGSDVRGSGAEITKGCMHDEAGTLSIS